MTRKICKECRFWDECNSMANIRVGRCRRYPPQIENAISIFPSTVIDDWCGEWTPTAIKNGIGNDIKIRDLGVPVRVTHVLDRLGITTLGDLEGIDWDLLLRQRNFGRSSARCLYYELQKVGVELPDRDNLLRSIGINDEA